MKTSLPLFIKDLRALLPLWAPVMAVLYLNRLDGTGDFQEFAVLAYIAGSFTLGAHALGHEHTYRTLAVLLAQPIDRRRLLLTKAAALAPLLLSVGAAAWYFVARGFSPHPPIALVLLPAAGGLFVAPLLTMLSRSQMGGIMLTAMFSGGTFVAAQLLAMKYSGLASREAEALALLNWQRAMYVAVAIGALLTWRTFMRLEAVEGHGRDLHLPAWFTRTGEARPGHPLSVLIRKELRIQQLTFVVAGIYATGEIVRFFVERAGLVEANRGFSEVMVPVYFGAIALVAGSLASAEERHYGTAEAQLLVPVSASRQWAIKAGTTLLLAVALGLGLPLLLVYGLRPGDAAGIDVDLTLSALVIAWLTACGLYVSSLSTSAVRALTFAGPFALGLHLLVVFVVRPWNTTEAGIYLGGVAVVSILLALAGANHVRADRGFGRVAWQMAATAALIAIGLPFLTTR